MFSKDRSYNRMWMRETCLLKIKILLLAEPGVPVSARGTERCPGPQRGAVHT